MLRLHEADQLHFQHGEQLLSALGGSPGDDRSRSAFVRLLQVAADDELIGFELTPPLAMAVPRPEEYAYLQSLRNFRLRTNGIDRARGQRIAQEQPQPDEDDGRRLPIRVIENVADAIGVELRGNEARSFLLDAGVPEDRCPEEVVNGESQYIRSVLGELMERGPSGRRIVRNVIGRWLSDDLEIGPTHEQWAKLNDALARAGWKPKRSTLVIAPPSRPTRYQPPEPPTAVASDGAAHDPDRARKVMVVYGRDETNTRALFDLLRALGLEPQEWTQLIRATGSGAPYTGQVLDRALEIVQAVVVLFTPDDEARLHYDLMPSDERVAEGALRGQPRPNVLYEAGLAFGRHPDRTILVELGDLRGLSDLAGRHTVQLEQGSAALHDLAERLRTAGCTVDTSGSHWLVADRFVTRPGSTGFSTEPADGELESEPLLRLVREILGSALGRPAAPDVTAELVRRLRQLDAVLIGDALFSNLPGRRLSVEEQKRVSYDLFEHDVLARNPHGQGWVRGGFRR
jgi:predicted nucleotide-binding protein